VARSEIRTAKPRSRNQSFFFHDDWKLSNRRTLNLGLHWDRFGPPSFKDSAVSRFMVDFDRQHGEPFSVTVSTGVANMGTTNYANRIGNSNLPSSQRTIDPSFDTAAFAVPAQDTTGNAGRGILFGRPTRRAERDTPQPAGPRDYFGG